MTSMAAGNEFLLFFAVGVTNTAVDFVIFNLLTRPAVGWARIPANIVSVTIAMIWSFLANWFFVFNPDGPEWLARAGRFVVITAFSAFVLQNVILYVTTYLWKRPINATAGAIRKLRLMHRFSDEMISRNICKLMAVSGGLVWNFCWYKFFVYAS